MKERWLTFVLITHIGAAVFAQPSPQLIWEEGRAVAVSFPGDTGSGKVSVSLLGSTTPILGSLSVPSAGILLFKPALPFQPGAGYQITTPEKILKFTIPENTTEPPQVVRIYPTANLLPANQLKMYVVFDQPMRADGVCRHITLVNGETIVENAILPLEPALWNADNTVLTLWLDPGRIKRELGPNQQQGNPLQPDQEYELTVKPSMTNKNGQMLVKASLKAFRTGDFDRARPNVEKWEIQLPAAETNDALSVAFDEPLDFRSLEGKVVVLLAEKEVGGELQVMENETVLNFYPSIPWKKGNYTIEVHPSIEDLAGNRLNRLFDEDIRAISEDKPFESVLTLYFTVK